VVGIGNKRKREREYVVDLLFNMMNIDIRMGKSISYYFFCV